jgi:hypothetical protein
MAFGTARPQRERPMRCFAGCESEDANALGLSILPFVLLRADQVIA